MNTDEFPSVTYVRMTNNSHVQLLTVCDKHMVGWSLPNPGTLRLTTTFALTSKSQECYETALSFATFIISSDIQSLKISCTVCLQTKVL